MLACKVCGAKVSQGKDGMLVRSCQHKDAPVVADMRAAMAGAANVR